ncbi:MAG TPA: hypothetical protein VE986_03985 [Hyphomicrobiales bacterium]|nr:hypothetical protein [Hyphomicrobiales bacterium]
MTAADFLRFLIIVSLGVLAFITFLVAGTIIGLMWLDSWSCGVCRQYPVGFYILGILGLLILISISAEASEATDTWHKWIVANWMTLVVVLASIFAFILVLNWWWLFG